MLRKQVWIFSVSMLIALVMTYFIYPSFHLVYFSNTIFTISMVLLVAGGVMLIIQGGFFSAFIANFNYFLKITSKTGRMADEIEKKEPARFHETRRFSMTAPTLWSGLILLIISFLFSL